MGMETIVISDSDEDLQEWNPLERQLAVPVKRSHLPSPSQNRSPFTIVLSDDDTPRKRLREVIEISDDESPFKKFEKLKIDSPRHNDSSLFPVKSGKMELNVIPCKKKKIDFSSSIAKITSTPHPETKSVSCANSYNRVTNLKDLWNASFKSKRKPVFRLDSELPDLSEDVSSATYLNMAMTYSTINRFEVKPPDSERQRSFMDVFKMPGLPFPPVPSKEKNSLPDLSLIPSNEIVRPVTQFQDISVVSSHHFLSPLVHFRILTQRNFNTCNFGVLQNFIIKGWIDEGEDFLNIALEEILRQTTSTFRPPPELIIKLFEWLINAPNKLQLFQCYKILYHIHTLHGLPTNLDLWEYFQKAGNIIETLHTKSPLLKLEISNSLIQLLCHFLECNLLGQRLSKEQFTLNRTLSYKLLCSNISCEKLKNILSWIEIIIKYYSANKHSVCLLILENLQKLISYAVMTSRIPKELCKQLLREFCKVYSNLKTLVERQLLFQTMKSDLLVTCAIEKLFEQIAVCPLFLPVEVKKESAFPLALRKIILYYFHLQPVGTEKKKFSKAEIVAEFVFLLSKLLSSYLLSAKSQQNLALHRRQSDIFVHLSEDDRACVTILNKSICELEELLKTNYPDIDASVYSAYLKSMKLLAFLEEANNR